MGEPDSHPSRPAAVLYATQVARVSAFYAALAGLECTQVEADHSVLESPGFQLVVVAIPAPIAATIELTTPPVRREDTPVKLVFPVPSLAAARVAAAGLGGVVDPVEREWTFQASRVCDGHDPEGNVVQSRETAG